MFTILVLESSNPFEGKSEKEEGEKGDNIVYNTKEGGREHAWRKIVMHRKDGRERAWKEEIFIHCTGIVDRKGRERGMKGRNFVYTIHVTQERRKRA